jgi:dipeptidyl aminopeptidase/acylaminoacyl peptidase
VRARWREPAPGERDAGERSWEVVRAAFAAREPVPRRRAKWPLLVTAAGAAVVAAALSPPGLAVLDSIRDAVRGEASRDELVGLPAPGRLLVNAPAGTWVVQQDGSKRFLGGYADASWSPHGLYLAAARSNTLVAMEPNGRVHWKLARPAPVGAPTWSDATPPCCRIAYLAGHALRVVNGDGTGDRELTPNAVGAGLAAFAWRPWTHQLAYRNARDELQLVDVDRGTTLWQRPTPGVERLEWSDDGSRLLVSTRRPLVLDRRGRTIAVLPRGVGLPAAFVPHSHALALVQSAAGRSSVLLFSGPRYEHRRAVFSGPGALGGLAWSPNGRRLLVDWRSADQWLFIPTTPGRRVVTVARVGGIFDSGPEHYATIGGWCCR